MKRPFTVYERKWITNGKKKSSFQYSINVSSDLPSYICEDHQRKAISARSKTEATMKVMDLIKQLQDDLHNASAKHSFGNYTKDYMVDGKCHYQRYVQSEDRELAPSYMKEYRKLYTEYIATDLQLCNKKIADLTRADLIRYRERIVQKLGRRAVPK